MSTETVALVNCQPIAEIFEIVDQLLPAEKPDYIRERIIPRMNERSGREKPLTRSEIIERLYSIDPQKPGEIVEGVFERVWSKYRLSADVALEIADIVYYTLQPNCPDVLSNPDPWYLLHQITPERAYDFCILKYSTRILYGNQPNYKEIEHWVMAGYLG